MAKDHAFAEAAARRVLDDAKRIGCEIEVLRPVLDSFALLLSAQAALCATAPGWEGAMPPCDEDRLCQGIPLLADGGFQDVSAQLPDAATQLLPVMKQAFPSLDEEIEILERAIEGGNISAPELVDAAFGVRQAEVPGVSADVLGFVAWQMVKPFIERQGADLAELVCGLPWRRSVCPVCGGTPNFSRLLRIKDDAEYITGHGGVRFLRCATCSTQWRYKRVSCPKCGNEEPSKLGILRADGRPFERIDACEECGTYCLCQDATEFIEIPDADISALAMLPLELSARQKGYQPLAGHPWDGV